MKRRISERTPNVDIEDIAQPEKEGWKYQGEEPGRCIVCGAVVTVETYYHPNKEQLARIRVGCEH